MAASSAEEQPQPLPPPPQPPLSQGPPSERLHKIKSIHFLGRPTPVVLQNDNGPCPLVAICNVLLLKNQLNLSADVSEVSQEKLLSLVAERLIDSNSDIKNKDVGYLQNQQQNIADAIDLLPRLTTGIDVNTKFFRIDDFEFTPECAIFDLLDIPLYHGWLVDPQDYETAKAIGSKSYNTIMQELVSLQEIEGKGKDKPEGDSVDFVAATTAALGVPSPCLSRAKYFNESPCASSDEPPIRKGDAEEEAELLRILKLSETTSMKGGDSIAAGPCGEDLTANFDTNLYLMQFLPIHCMDNSQAHHPCEKVHIKPSISDGGLACNNLANLTPLEGPLEQDDPLSSKFVLVSNIDQPSFVQLGKDFAFDHLAKDPVGALLQDETKPSPLLGLDSVLIHEQHAQIQASPTACLLEETHRGSGTEFPASSRLDKDFQVQSAPEIGLNEETYDKEKGIENSTALSPDSDSSSGNVQNIEATESFTSSLHDSEPIYEGEEYIWDSATTIYEDWEPVYEGEVILGKQVDGHDLGFKDEITPREGELISNFLKNSSSQLTFYGLFSLQKGLKERELCVFFRNNHFSTMFKFEGELYLLTTDQGYLNQPGIIWEKLNEVNGNSVFYGSNFMEFMPERQTNGTWDEQNAVTSTAGYLATIGNSGQEVSSMNSDLELAIALQQQEFEQQQSQRRAPQQPANSGSSRLIPGPQTSRSNARTSWSSLKQDKKSKDGCSIM